LYISPDIRRVMGVALSEARSALEHGDVPVGAVALETSTSRLLSARHNEREATGDPTAHAEILALRDAADALGSWRLDAVSLVVTLEPCPMCAGALVASRVGRVVFGAADPRAGACGTLYNFASDPRLNHSFEVIRGVEADRCAALLEEFFGSRR
jgi:tRNA(adenine34) deaminase